MNQSFLKKVYYVESKEDSTVQIAMDLKVIEDRITWFDTIKERGMHIKKITDNNPEHFVFVRESNGDEQTYTFVPMTLEIYNTKVKDSLIHGRDFDKLEDLEKAFEETKNDAW